MAWTLPSALFFAVVAGTLVVMTAWEILQPTVKRKGWLPMATTRGDRLFISLLLAALCHVIWLTVSDAPLAYASVVAAMVAVVVWIKG